MYNKQVGCCVVSQSKSKHQASTQPIGAVAHKKAAYWVRKVKQAWLTSQLTRCCFASLRMCVFVCLHMSVPVCVCACLSAAISKLTRDTTEPVQLSTVVFCRRTEGLMTMVSPPHSRRRRDQSLLIRDIGEGERALVWAARYQRRLQQAVDYVIFHNMRFLNVSCFYEHTIALIEKQGGQSNVLSKVFFSIVSLRDLFWW